VNEELFATTQALMRLNSTTLNEAGVASYLHDFLSKRGFATELQKVADGRHNVFAKWPGHEPRVVLSTHMDCVPPYIAPSETDEFHLGRGACDAKGIIAAMLFAGDTLRAGGVHDFGYLFVVGEETDSIGAKEFTRTANHAGIRYIIDGEPTENKLSRGHKGVFAFKVSRKGRPGHSAYPELFDSAVHKLVGELSRLCEARLPIDDNFGTTTVNVGVVNGGLAGNVIAENAEAEIVCRLSRPLSEVEPLIRSVFSADTQFDVRTASDPADIYVPAGYDSDIVRFGTDVPHLKPICPLLLVGPGSIHDAHTEHEKLAKKQQIAAVKLYDDLVRRLLAER
jgi:acetylornithine deacetylase